MRGEEARASQLELGEGCLLPTDCKSGLCNGGYCCDAAACSCATRDPP